MINIQEPCHPKELEQLDVIFECKIRFSIYEKIEKNKAEDSLSQINKSNSMIVTKLTLSKVSNISVSDEEIKDIVKNVSTKGSLIK